MLTLQTLSILVSFSAITYSIITIFMYRENIKMRRLKSEPLIIAFLKSSEDSLSFSLHIKNVGEGFAENVTIKVTKDYLRYSKIDHPLSQAGIFKNGLTIFPSNYEMRFVLDLWENVKKNDTKNFVELEINYFRHDGKKRSQVFKLNFDEILGQYYSVPPDTYVGQIAHHLKEINKELRKKRAT